MFPRKETLSFLFAMVMLGMMLRDLAVYTTPRADVVPSPDADEAPARDEALGTPEEAGS